MGTEIKNAYMGQPGITDTTLHSGIANTQTRILKCTVANDTTTPKYISFHKVPSGQAVGDEYLILNRRVIGNRETYECPEVVGQVLDAGDSISAIAETVDQLSVSLDVVEVTV